MTIKALDDSIGIHRECASLRQYVNWTPEVDADIVCEAWLMAEGTQCMRHAVRL